MSGVQSIRTMSTGIMKNLNIDDYNFGKDDLSVAVMLKSYLNLMTREGAHDALEEIVTIGIREMPLTCGPVRIRDLDIPQDTWVTVNGPALAQMIEAAKAVAAINSEKWTASTDQRLLSKTLRYIREDFIPNMNGEKYVAGMPVEMAEFITDCYLAVR